MDSATIARRHPRSIRVLQPILRAYALGYLSSTTPKVITCLRRLRGHDLSLGEKLKELSGTLTSTIRPDAFPTFCALLVGGSTVFPLLLFRCLAHLHRRLGSTFRPFNATTSMRLLRLVSALLSAWFGFNLLNRRPIRVQGAYGQCQGTTESNNAAGQDKFSLEPHSRPQFAGRTMDLTLFSLTRAADLMVFTGWAQWKRWRKSKNQWTIAERVAPKLADSGMFATSAAIVMWAWFYMPERLPKSYGKWIGEVANVDGRLVEALRRARRGNFVYGKDTGQASLLQPMCEEYDWPMEWGDPSKTIPIPCEMVHMGSGPSCEKHAVSRFARTFKFACATYIPLQVVLRLRSMKSVASLRQPVSAGLRSSAFLASFVSLFYYSVCLARTRIGPQIFRRATVTPLMWDSGLCVGAGCMMCGWSILVENARKRQEIALFVAPRAAATVLPRLYDKQYQYRERIAFSISAAILLTCLQEKPEMVRGVFGRIGRSVLMT
ncbi:integral membrane protein [Aspergillus sclerotioniger CBS 115572]|uniref:Integral membrane protein n=1 Tax=Aspergillus sclerotioniger CBS 115572 TaxID=1450535 RepID=A0A317WSF9_9EURO|nr:integral membrane protein [Aspergillus sclerotioniger CBS 115572]PWY89394.1 integral membrane protein [Aspergillus sclerotioniger CBS 115572]